MKTAIVTDTNCGIFPTEGEKLGVFTLPMPVILNGKEYFEGVDLTHREFYQLLESGADASTSQPAPGDVLSVWEKILGQGFDEIVHIPMSSGLSASYQTALGLADEFRGKVRVVDNHRVSVTQYDGVMDAIGLMTQGKNAVEIKEALERTGLESIIFLGVDTLKYFKKNGRCTAATAALGTVLNIKPLLKCDGERFDAVAKVRGTVNCRKKLLEAAVAAAEELRRGGPISIGVAGSFMDKADEEAWYEEVKAAFPNDRTHFEPLAFSVICHTGPNAFGLGISRRVIE